MKPDLTGMTLDELKELHKACHETLEILQKKDYEEKVNNFKKALNALVKDYPSEDCVNDGNFDWSWEELKSCLIV